MPTTFYRRDGRLGKHRGGFGPNLVLEMCEELLQHVLGIIHSFEPRSGPAHAPLLESVRNE